MNYMIRSAILLIAFFFVGKAAYAQTDSNSVIVTDPFTDELYAIDCVFTDTTNTDTLKFSQLGVTDPTLIMGFEMMTGDEVLMLIDDHDLMSFNGDNDIIYEMNTSFTYDGQSFDKRWSYGVEWKHLNNVLLDNALFQNIDCIHIGEAMEIQNVNPDIPPMEIMNHYYVLFDGTDHVATIAYNKIQLDVHYTTQKYIEIPGSSNKPAHIAPGESYKVASDKEYLTITPNPARATVKLDIMLQRSDNALITIDDINGKIVRENKAGILESRVNYTYHEDISALPAGVYTVRLNTPHTTKTVKLIISK